MSRTPSAHAHNEALKAAFHLIAEKGIEGTSVDAIAQLSGVSKATIYKHWPNKDALCIEALGQMVEELPSFDSGNTRKDLILLLRSIAFRKRSEKAQQIFPRIIGYAAGNPEFGQAIRQYFEKPQSLEIKRLLRQGIEAGELRSDIDFDFSTDLLIGPIMRRRFFNGREIPAAFIDQLVELFWKGHSSARVRRKDLASK